MIKRKESGNMDMYVSTYQPCSTSTFSEVRAVKAMYVFSIHHNPPSSGYLLHATGHDEKITSPVDLLVTSQWCFWFTTTDHILLISG